MGGIDKWVEALEQQVALHAVVEAHGAQILTELVKVRGIATTERNRTRWMASTALALKQAVPFYWAPDITRAVGASASGMPEWSLRREDVPAFAGFFWFGERIPLETGSGLQAISWLHYADSGLDYDAAVAMDQATSTGIFLTFFTDLRGTATRRPFPTSYYSWNYGETLRSAADRWAAQAERAGEKGLVDQSSATEKMRLFASFLAFVKQEIVETGVERPGRGLRRRLEKVGWLHEPSVRVVRLRRRNRRGVIADANGSGHDYSCQWLVRGHWRGQWFPKAAEHRPVWISPYVKGPEDKPLKPSAATIFTVVR